jgi:hypothetical protein
MRESGCEVDQSILERIRRALDGHNGPDQQLIAETGLELIALLLRKNSDYGSSAWASPVLAPGMSPLQAIQCRMSDKVARLSGLSGGHTAEVNESLVDTMSDLTGYGMLWLGYAKKQQASAVAVAEFGSDFD